MCQAAGSPILVSCGYPCGRGRSECSLDRSWAGGFACRRICRPWSSLEAGSGLKTYSLTRIGDIDIHGLADGDVNLPREYYASVDWEVHGSILSANGTIDRPIGCFLLATKRAWILVDVGVGPRRLSWAWGGNLPAALKSVGVENNSIDRVVCTHAHIDHIGWLVGGQKHPFGDARIALGATEFEALMRHGRVESQAAMTRLQEQGILDLLVDGEELAPGITVRATPGHTPGHLSVVVSSGSQRAFILGDVVVCPEEIGASWTNTSDDDPVAAVRTRDTMWRELGQTGDLAVGSHFPGLAFGRVKQAGTERSFVQARIGPDGKERRTHETVDS
jgi:glyoxylase-like metal-dependent hydrolase (beta-lactamase superfamily II)